MPTRPHSISELAQFSRDDSLPSSKGIKDWLRVAGALRTRGQQAIQDGDIQAGFIYLARSTTYILEKIPHHPAYDNLTLTQMGNLKNWRASDPRNSTAPSELQETYGAYITPIVIPRAARGQGDAEEDMTRQQREEQSVQAEQDRSRTAKESSKWAGKLLKINYDDTPMVTVHPQRFEDIELAVREMFSIPDTMAIYVSANIATFNNERALVHPRVWPSISTQISVVWVTASSAPARRPIS
ncbi:hypothetical protein M408DRAFT_22730 [Serendipita vermifera MAFF 305830]|uniref:USP8 dimerisation domain-containing protein n=1 Tax=Serendipita vermifera MAFF 305830 TaxID=933852 RepID=A0A0C2XLH7_SERVB|nr:hypothetical protein M408DRAFT_22730 [Serendipita vermifera MAFF 305830]